MSFSKKRPKMMLRDFKITYLKRGIPKRLQCTLRVSTLRVKFETYSIYKMTRTEEKESLGLFDSS